MEFSAYAPGRVNLIGEHTDYTGGLSLPFAIQLGVTIAGHTTDCQRVTAISTATEDSVEFDIASEYPNSSPEWGKLLAAVASELHAHGMTTRGAALEISSTLPLGSGLSSSAAISVATALALSSQPDELLADGVSIARVAQLAETSATGVPCGIMDQIASAFGQPGSALLLDSRDTSFTPIALPAEWRYLVVNSGEHRTLAGSEYGLRSAQCAEAESQIGPLREASLGKIESIGDPTVRNRARHVVTENQRVTDFVEAVSNRDIENGGELISQSHRSLRDDFDVSTDRLDALVENLESQRAVMGARLLGGGFGGCVIALCKEGAQIPTGFEGWFVEPSTGARYSPRSAVD